ncbi:putative HD superfamily hydrolase of NAD metabolism [Halobacteroides halobius DSM 5150]|uniref:bis(5'-nucleosyl)-tetraphosphatase (symmetrical) n=1 Tax=Halobacteroides halobius (strain ATCC 35273 / DSM 5150 / MD-1) TaxID=748449 RepID=L0K984_HALHC|nr:bis(5'-nucleosyl)-tetraphosphatase (symmetrical) YqeK [Halobacteroides halobius]AGB41827.1 putative HD superfamily hydrolase of NAD metabolism [Halobacteroides halobius DSM 5150]
MTEEEIIRKLKDMISTKRLKHSLGVRNTAVKLASRYNVSTKKARWAGLLHDCAKGFSKKLLLQKAKEFGIVIDSVCQKIPALLHGPVGAQLVKRRFKISDQDILQAISLHTLGSPQMNDLDKIIFLADYIEPNRDCKAIDKLRAKVKGQPLNEAVRIACDNTIRYNLEQEAIIHPQTIETRNSLL